MKHRIVPSIEDVRRKLDDWAGKNDLMEEVEYSADDIVTALVWPVMRWRELPPHLKRFPFGLMNFPYYEQWVLGASAELLRRSVFHYTRNKLLSSHGGISGDEKNRDQQYLRLAMTIKEEYEQWVRFKKHELNMSRGQGWGTLHSEYINYQAWR